MLTIRYLTPADLQDMERILRDSYGSTSTGTVDHFFEAFTERRGSIWGAFDDDRLLAFAGFIRWHDSDPVSYSMSFGLWDRGPPPPAPLAEPASYPEPIIAVVNHAVARFLREGRNVLYRHYGPGRRPDFFHKDPACLLHGSIEDYVTTVPAGQRFPKEYGHILSYASDRDERIVRYTIVPELRRS